MPSRMRGGKRLTRLGHMRKTSHVKIAIGGASGFIGSALVPALEAQGHEVLRLVRRAPQDAAEIGWDPASGSLDATSLTGVGALVCLNGATIAQRWTDARKREILESRSPRLRSSRGPQHSSNRSRC